MAKDKSIYVCNECGGSNPKWLGKCPHCGAWNSLEETAGEPGSGGKDSARITIRRLAGHTVRA